MEYELVKQQLLIFYNKTSKYNRLDMITLELSQILADRIARFPYYPYFYGMFSKGTSFIAEQAFLSFIRCDFISFFSNMKRFVSLMGLPEDDIPFPTAPESEEAIHPRGYQKADKTCDHDIYGRCRISVVY